MKRIGKVVAAVIVCIVSYMVCLYPASFTFGLLMSFTAKATVGYLIMQHPVSALWVVAAILSAIASAILASVITYALYRRIWSEGPASPQFSN
jgi:hypothetical protein